MGDAASEFLAAARAFRAALVADDVDEGQFARGVRNALARVYLAAALLGPGPADETDDEPPAARPAPEESRALWGTLAARLGAQDRFVDVFDPSLLTDDDSEPMWRSITQELVEVDDDLAESIAWLEHDVPGVRWHVRFAFENHWGEHALACLRPLHQLAVFGVV